MSSNAAQDLQPGDKVSWNWGSSHPTGTVKAIYEEEKSITSKNGNKITRKGDEENPAVEIVQDNKNPVIKRASELNEVDV
ncbi:hypothetical protein FRC14_000956 [Serendipita sp. 396]|nr:hypothetical protein FRC14_000956 [Serendipita sp. 396]KAG8772980.1 hypothetical protein FRC15_002348 [Serendipita sp. 397]KAG8797509.1 hypothetical protein FRC16_008795 [Serendipita sp. 398]KAG8809267.1 hypothetical protein FRC19_005341 [Serendipita sp. 401]KAG8842231.1 hypothetical protein FRB91_004299 [Serendipita sp. 411]KAG9022729.1 hypothetical protein FS842_005938 [Serendipita sp. 407]